MGASNQTYSTFPSASGSGTGIPQLLSRVIARLCKPLSSQLLHCPYTLGFHSLWPFRIHSFRNSSYFCNGKYQCLVFLFTGTASLRVLCGLMSCSGLREEPQRSHWSPKAFGFPQMGQVPVM